MKYFGLLLMLVSLLSGCGSDGQVPLSDVNFQCTRGDGPCAGIEVKGTRGAVVMITKEACAVNLWNDGKFIAGATTTIQVSSCTDAECAGGVAAWFSPANASQPIFSVPKGTYNKCVIVDSNDDSNYGNAGDKLGVVPL